MVLSLDKHLLLPTRTGAVLSLDGSLDGGFVLSCDGCHLPSNMTVAIALPRQLPRRRLRLFVRQLPGRRPPRLVEGRLRDMPTSHDDRTTPSRRGRSQGGHGSARSDAQYPRCPWSSRSPLLPDSPTNGDPRGDFSTPALSPRPARLLLSAVMASSTHCPSLPLPLSSLSLPSFSDQSSPLSSSSMASSSKASPDLA